MPNPIAIETVNPEPNGYIALTFGECNEREFSGNRIAYVESDHLGTGGFYHADQLPDLFAALADCAENQSGDNLSEFIIPARNGTFVLITIGVA